MNNFPESSITMLNFQNYYSNFTHQYSAMQLVFATNNPNKLREVQSLIPQGITLLSLEDIGCHEEVPETQDTIEGNAIQKSVYIKTHFGYDCFADDTGLEVDALNGEPGVYSARYAGEQRNSEDNIQKVLKKLRNEAHRKAQFKTVIALQLYGKQHLFTGICKGEITHAKHGDKGFGYDPIFKAEGYDQTFAEISLEEKNRIGHRGKAMDQLVGFLNSNKVKNDL